MPMKQIINVFYQLIALVSLIQQQKNVSLPAQQFLQLIMEIAQPKCVCLSVHKIQIPMVITILVNVKQHVQNHYYKLKIPNI